MSETYIEITGNIIVHHPVKQADREDRWTRVLDIIEMEHERNARDERRAAYYRDLLQHDSLGEAFQKAVT